MSRDEESACGFPPPAAQIGVAVRMDIFATLQHEKERLSQSESRIADILLNDFEFAVNASIIPTSSFVGDTGISSRTFTPRPTKWSSWATKPTKLRLKSPTCTS